MVIIISICLSVCPSTIIQSLYCLQQACVKIQIERYFTVSIEKWLSNIKKIYSNNN